MDAPHRPSTTVDVSDTATPGGRCPACGEPLFAWLTLDSRAGAGDASAHVLDRCENCGLVLDRADAGEGLTLMVERIAGRTPTAGETTVELPNAASLQATIGAESWAGLRPETEPAVITPRALELLLEREGLEVARSSYAARPGMASMMGTILNLLSFNRDFPRAALRGELRPRNSRGGLIGFAIDTVVTLFTAIPVAILTVALEGAAIAVRRGGVLSLSVRRR